MILRIQNKRKLNQTIGNHVGMSTNLSHASKMQTLEFANFVKKIKILFMNDCKNIKLATIFKLKSAGMSSCPITYSKSENNISQCLLSPFVSRIRWTYWLLNVMNVLAVNIEILSSGSI